jgi:hypothetical protein
MFFMLRLILVPMLPTRFSDWIILERAVSRAVGGHFGFTARDFDWRRVTEGMHWCLWVGREIVRQESVQKGVMLQASLVSLYLFSCIREVYSGGK